MNTAQESLNDPRVSPPPCPLPHSQEQNGSEDSTNNNFNSTPQSPIPPTEPFPASAYHVPPKRFAPRPNAYAYDDSFHRPPETEPLPDRCQFMFSDGRQCTMARSDIHPFLCVYHSDREEQLFGDPSHRCETRKLDFPELFSASRDLSTAAGVNRALAQVFRLLAQRRISRQEAATFGHLAKLLLRTISLMNAESTIQSEETLGDLLTPEESLSDNVHTRVPSKGVIPKTSSPISVPTVADRTESGRSGEDEESRAGSPEHAAFACSGVQSRAGSATHAPARATPARLNEVACVSEQSTSSICNSPEISTSENAGLNPIQNEHLQKSAVSALCSSGRPPKPRSPAHADSACAGVMKPAFEAKAET